MEDQNEAGVDVYISPNSTWLVTSRLDPTRYVLRVELVVWSRQARHSQMHFAGHVERVVSCLDVTRRATWNLGYSQPWLKWDATGDFRLGLYNLQRWLMAGLRDFSVKSLGKNWACPLHLSLQPMFRPRTMLTCIGLTVQLSRAAT